MLTKVNLFGLPADLDTRGWIVYSNNLMVTHKRRYKKDAVKVANMTMRKVATVLHVEKWDATMTLEQWKMWKRLQK